MLDFLAVKRDVVSMPMMGRNEVALSYQYYWSDQFRSNLLGDYARLVNDTGIMNTVVLAATNNCVESGHAT